MLVSHRLYNGLVWSKEDINSNFACLIHTASANLDPSYHISIQHMRSLCSLQFLTPIHVIQHWNNLPELSPLQIIYYVITIPCVANYNSCVQPSYSSNNRPVR